MLYYSERHKNTTLKFALEEVIYQKQSAYQLVQVFKSKDWGRILVLDGCTMLTEVDEFFYHESIAHLPMSLHEGVEDILIVGGGDGGAARELLKYGSVQNIDLVEIDGDVINASKEYLPFVGASLLDPKVHVHVEDAASFIQSTDKKYDLIIADSSDPIGFAEVLIGTQFYQGVQKNLKPDGLFVGQSSSPLTQADEFRQTWQNLKGVFAHARCAWSLVPTYPGAIWSFVIGSRQPIQQRLSRPINNCRFWRPEMQAAMLCAPCFIRDIL